MAFGYPFWIAVCYRGPHSQSREAVVRIFVEEGLHPNGTDLVTMGEHLLNEVAKRNGAPRETKVQAVQLFDLGEGYALSGFDLRPGISPEGEVVCFLIANVLKPSQLVQVQAVVPVAIGVIGKTTTERLRASYEKAVNPVDQ